MSKNGDFMTEEEKIISWKGDEYISFQIGNERFEDLDVTYENAGFKRISEIGSNCLIKISWYHNIEKNIYILEHWDCNTRLFAFVCFGQKEFSECFDHSLKVSLNYIKLLNMTEEFEK